MAGKWLTQATVDSSVAGTSVITTVAGVPNFDFIVPTNTTKRMVIPNAFGANASSVQGANRANGLYPALAIKTLAGNASILVGEY